MQTGFLRRAVGLARVAGDAGADDVFPRRRAAAVAGDDVVEIQILAVKNAATILTGIAVALEDVMTGEFDFLFWQAVEHGQQNHAWNSDFEGDAFDARTGGVVLRHITPLIEIVGLKRAVGIGKDDLSVAFKEKAQRPANGAYIHRLPQPVENQHVLVKERTHNQSKLGRTVSRAAR